MKRIVSTVAKCMVCLLSGGIFATLILTIAFCIPLNRENVDASLKIVSQESLRPVANALIYQGDDSIHNTYSFQPTVLDQVTDRLMLSAAFAEGENSLILAMDMSDYPRYWHGYVFVLRLLFYFMDYGDFRVFNCFLQISLVFYIAFSIWDRMRLKRYVLVLLTSYALLMPLALFFSLQYSWVFYIAFGGTLFVLKKGDLLFKKDNYVLFFLIMGMLTSFFDLLTYPLVTWGIPLVWWIVVSKDRMGGRERLKKVMFSGIAWASGYGIFWLLKWIIATPILGQNVLTNAAEQIFLRVSGVGHNFEAFMQAYERWEVLYCNWRHYEYGLYGVILAAWMLWAVFHSVRRGWNVRLKSGVYLLIPCSCVAWYLILFNHTLEHNFFTYRIYNMGILAFLCFLAECVPAERSSKRRGWKEYLAVLSAWCVLFGLSVFPAMLAREDITAISVGDYREVWLKEGDVVSVTFTPTFADIKMIGFLLDAPGGTGFYEVSLTQEDEVLHRLEIPLSEHVEAFYHTEEIDWKLTPGDPYEMMITLHDNKEEAAILVTQNDEMVLNEYQGMRINGMERNGQLLGSFEYHTRILSRLRLAYNALMWMTLLGAVSALFRAAIMRSNAPS